MRVQQDVSQSDEADDTADGYTLVEVTTNTDETKHIYVDNLQAQVEIEYDPGAQRGVSVAFDQGNDGHGIVHVRLIADHNSRAALSRKDADGVTHFKVHFHPQDL